MLKIITTLEHWIKTNKVLVLLFFIIALASFLRIYDISIESIWLDEAHSVRVSGLSLPSVISEAAVGKHAPLYFIILHFWTGLLGISEVSLRAISAIFGVLSVCAIYWVGCSLYNRRVGLISSLLSAISLFHIYYSQEARPYSLLLFLSLLSFLFFIKILKQDKKIYYLCYLIFNILLCYTHVLGLLTLASQIFFFLLFWSKYKSQRFKLLAMLGATMAGLLPLVHLIGSEAASMIDNGFWISEPSLLSIAGTIISFCGTHVFLVLIFFFLSGSALFSIRKREGAWSLRKPIESLKGISWNIKLENIDEFLLLTIWLSFPIILAFIISKYITPIYVTRYLIGASPALYLLVAKGLSRFNTRQVLCSILMVILLLSSFGLVNYYAEVNKEQWRDVAHYVELNAKENDVAVFCANYVQRPFDYYYNGEIAKFGIARNVEDKQEMATLVNQTITGRERLWLILSHSGSKLPTPVENYMMDRYEKVIEQEFVGVRLLLFDLAKGNSNV